MTESASRMYRWQLRTRTPPQATAREKTSRLSANFARRLAASFGQRNRFVDHLLRHFANTR